MGRSWKTPSHYACIVGAGEDTPRTPNWFSGTACLPPSFPNPSPVLPLSFALLLFFNQPTYFLSSSSTTHRNHQYQITYPLATQNGTTKKGRKQRRHCTGNIDGIAVHARQRKSFQSNCLRLPIVLHRRLHALRRVGPQTSCLFSSGNIQLHHNSKQRSIRA